MLISFCAQCQRTRFEFEAMFGAGSSLAGAVSDKKKKSVRHECGARFLKWKSAGLADVAIHSLGDLILGYRTHDLLDHLAVLENQNRRNAANVVTARGVH